MIKAIVFDMDDTLYKEYDFVFGGFKTVAKYIGDKYSLCEEEIYNKIIEVFNLEGRGKIFNFICDEYKLEEDIETLVDIYRFHKPDIKLYEDADEILNWCRGNGIKTGIITDGMSKVQWNKVKALGLENRVDKIIVTDDLGREFWKPHVRSYEEMLKMLNVRGEECAYIGDNPIKDFIGANKLGYTTLRIIREVGDHMNVSLAMDGTVNELIENSLVCVLKYIKKI